MHVYSSFGASPIAGIASLLLIAIGICAIVAYFLAIGLLVKAARRKDPSISSGKLWFVGIFLTPAVLALIAIALPRCDDGTR